MGKKIFMNSRTFFFFYLSGVIFIASIIYYIQKTIVQTQQTEESIHFEKAVFLLEEKINAYIHGLQGMGGVYLSNNFSPTPKQIEQYARYRNFFNNFPGTLGFGFIRRLPIKDTEKFIQYRKLLFPDFNLKTFDSYKSQYRHIVEVIEPYEVNKEALGLDIATEEKRYNAAIQAMEEGEASLTAPISLVSTKYHRKINGFLYFLPLYRTLIVPKTIKEREKEIVGWSYTAIDIEAIRDFLLRSVDYRLILKITDENGEKILSDDRLEKKYNLDYQSRRLKIGGRTWLIEGFSIPGIKRSLINYFLVTIFILAAYLYYVLLSRILRLEREKELSENKNVELENWQQAVLDGAEFSIIATNPNGQITIFNKGAEKLLGYDAKEMIHKKTPEFFHEHSEVEKRAKELSEELCIPIKAGFDAFVAKARLRGVDINEWTYISSSGRKIPVRLCITVLRNADYEIIGYLGIAEDLSELRKLQNTMVTNAKMSALGEMASGVAHEINNPLTIISLRAGVMKLQLDSVCEDKEPFKTGLDVIISTSLRIAKIVKGLRSFSRQSSNDPFEMTDLNTIIQETLDLSQARIESQKIKLIIESDSRIKIYCRPVQISQVLMNLLNNSIDAVKGKKDPWIAIKTSIGVNGITISVMDSGEGIEMSIAERMMEPFFTTKQVGLGTGLGLSISKGIVEEHGGQLNYCLNHGNTEFVISIPRSIS